MFSKFWAGKLNSANINDKSTTTQIKININPLSFPPNNIINASNVSMNTWCSSWWWHDINDTSKRFEIWNGEASTCGTFNTISGFIPRRLQINGIGLSWNGNNDTGTETLNNFGYWFGK